MEYYNIVNEDYINICKNDIIFPKIKLEILDNSENILFNIIEDIQANNGSISINYEQGIRRSCSITISDPTGKYLPDSDTGLFWINRKFKIYLGLKNNNDIYWFSQGIFYVTNPKCIHNYSNKTITINGVDKFGIFTSELNYNQLEGTYIIYEGTSIYSAIKDILMLDMGNGNVIDPIEPILDPKFKNYILPYDIKKAPSSYMGDILIEFANIMGCDIFYDVEGHLNITSGSMDIYYGDKSPVWEYSDNLREYMDSSLSLDYVSVFNSVIVVGANVNDKIYIGQAKNNNPNSNVRIELIGEKKKYIESSAISAQQQADEYAEYMLNRLSIIQSSIGFNSTMLPHLDVDKIINISDEYFRYDKQRFIIQSLSIPLSYNGTIAVNCTNIASLPYYNFTGGGS